MQVASVLKHYLSTLENETTRVNYAIALRDFLINLHTIEQITAEHIQEYKDTLKDKSAQTVAARLAAVRSFCDHCWTNGWLDFNPGLYIKNDHVEKYAQAKNIKFDDFKKLLEVMDLSTLVGVRDYFLMRLIFITGDPVKALSLPFNYEFKDTFKEIKEMYETRLSEATNLAKLYYGYLFFNIEELDNKQPISISAVRKVIIKYTNHAKFPRNHFDFQALKRLRAKQIYDQTQSVDAVQKFCGHSNPRATKAFIKTLY